MVIITNKNGIEFEVSEELANKFIKSGDIKGFKTLEGDFVQGEVEVIQDTPKKRKNITRNPK